MQRHDTLRRPRKRVRYFERRNDRTKVGHWPADVPTPPGLRRSILALGGEELLVLSFPVGKFSIPDSLSKAERQVLDLLLRGASHAEIATARHTAVRTVCNQVASIYRKTQVSSRMELVLKLRRPSRRR